MYDPIFGGAPAPDPSETEGLTATAGQPREAGNGGEIPSEEALVNALRDVYDPEIPVNIYDLGLIYDLDVAESGDVSVEMTLTTPGCPVAGQMPQWTADAVAMVPGTGKVTVTLTWDPPWTMDQMSEDAKLALGLM
jgi:FeS assembly SUF system protein